MAFIYTSGGGRLGNQILNLIHLLAFKNEYKIKVLKINDCFLESKKGNLMYEIDDKISNWKIYNNNKNLIFYRLFLKIYIRLIHFYFYFSSYKKSYKIGLRNNYPKLILGKNLGNNFSIEKLINQSKIYNLAICGWGLRDWELVSKHKKKIVRSLKISFCDYLNFKFFSDEKYLLVHIRRSDFLDVNEFQELNFSDETWFKGIIKICEIKSLKKVIIFSDSPINNFLLTSLESKGLKVELPEKKNIDENFLKLFFAYVYNSSWIICNASSLVLSISFLSHEYIYLPSIKDELREIFLNDAHKLYPTCLNWN